MKKERIVNEEFEEERRKVMMENFEVFVCSGGLDHTEECSGDCGVEKLDELDIELNKEKILWGELGIPNQGSIPGTQIPGIPIDTFHLQSSHDAVLKILVNKGIVTEEELNDVFRQIHLARMKMIRMANEEAILAARRRSQIVPGGILPRIEMPPQRRTRMQ